MKITGAILFQKSVHCTALVGEDSNDILMSHQKKAKKKSSPNLAMTGHCVLFLFWF